FGDAQYINYNAGVFDIGSSGVHSLKIRVFEGKLNLINISTAANAESLSDFSETLTSKGNGETLIGNVTYAADGLTTSESDSKCLVKYGNTGLSDYSVSVNVSVESGKGGILFRTKNFSHTSRQNLTDNQLQGYLVCVDKNIVSLIKYNYNLKTLDSKVPFDEDGNRVFANGKTNKLTVQIIKNVVSVYVNDKLLITCADAEAFTDGYWGLYSDGGKLTFSDLVYKNL
ncbi:MAG: family 16 glycoside hydrolase, partial [Candidatus Scatosoma sp.]